MPTCSSDFHFNLIYTLDLGPKSRSNRNRHNPQRVWFFFFFLLVRLDDWINELVNPEHSTLALTDNRFQEETTEQDKKPIRALTLASRHEFRLAEHSLG